FSRQYSLAALKYASRHKNVRLIIAPRGELMPSALQRKKLIKSLFLWCVKGMMTKNTEFHVTSDEERAALKKHFGKHRVWKIKNLPSKISNDKKNFSKDVGSVSIAMIGRIHPIKNIDYAIDLMNDVTGDVTLDIYGPEEDKKYVERCKEMAASLPSNIKVNFKGIVEHDAVGDTLKKYHVFLSPTQSENYGHSIIEGLLCGVPAIISNNTPWHGLESDLAGYDIDLGNRDLFVKALQSFVDMDEDTYCKWSACASSYITSRLAVQETVEKYVEMLVKK
ncbi:MAG: glycosyltransferase, partial [Clostridia bacterium]|nr:glycosyltransferase [Clostridia bacterium]